MRRRLTLGLACSAAALAGDLSFIFANAVPRELVVLGAHAGVVAIALYGVAFRALEDLLPGRIGRLVWLSGTLGGGLGAAIHGLTGFIILQALAEAPEKTLSVAETMSAAPGLLLPLSLVAVVVGLVGSGVFGVHVLRGRTTLPRGAVLLAPAVSVVVIGAVGRFSPAPDAVAAVAPNLAHLLFFGGLLMAGAHRR